ncbi:MAG: helix-turn-helix domain-containing protein [Armatimonadetes bacterium]|nr:helix-turn-helix domain-containing protein [Armatimonadota bacterium]
MSNIEQTNRSNGIGDRLKQLRLGHRYSMRQLAKKAGVTVSYVSELEAGSISPTIATLRKILIALSTDLGSFFTDGDSDDSASYVFRKAKMRNVVDPYQRYTFVLPRRPDVHMEILDELNMPGEGHEFETLTSDIAGYILDGDLYIEVGNDERVLLHTNDAFYVPAGRPIRGYPIKDKPVRLITVYVPPRY